MARELAKGIAQNSRPLTLITGAGASLSSRAPTTPAVHKRLKEATGTRLEDLIRERLHEIVDEALLDSLKPLFEDVKPNSGYRLLASLGRQRRINVINLNWDDAIEQACRLGGIAYAAFDPLGGPSLTEVEATLPSEQGVLVVHVHGTLAKRPRYSLLEDASDS